MRERPGPSSSRRAPRRDAVRNDAVVLQAAREVFAEQGPQASMESIAARAGLGVGTIYRRFPGKDALLDAIARLFVDELDEASAAALADPDPAAGLERFLDFVGAFNTEKRRYASLLAGRIGPDDEVSRRTFERIRQLTQKAVDAGHLAPDVTGDDIRALVAAIHAVVAATPDEDGSAWRRFVRIHLAGLRADRTEG
ncbi:TetR/AcrR family transcriptional regulator [Streptomyces thermoviolaceus]|uniref:TetR/AcrR family transcriptional regulator n=1 Tax=Streptomyces thermoviolaceus subsp. thermoviolaceus TaxID=66860 RepID=A0ABX0YN07_STRTL|nr:TetR/AcrR family transcriptional regulator [Streptomyces thermoviolaceus]MCM3263831.1 TetR/AcrR family transcriptional regulator [Streptomyces thermoviolaceus]NJP12726.1 TetR/AcrR family transcriptional regulator [Streptomyces thermoviolaceus subsp. thermoviolaceus]GHA80726.1 TetR family transcriptional regulator [Streptomyces thermoviolaceus subsp. thermoviolaceus]